MSFCWYKQDQTTFSQKHNTEVTQNQGQDTAGYVDVIARVQQIDIILRACPDYFFWISTYELMKY